MKIYVDGEMPSYIEQKIIHTNDGKLCEIGLCFNSTDIDENEENYIKQTAELEAEVRKQVVGEIKDRLNEFAYLMCSLECPTEVKYGVYVKDIIDVLDQIQNDSEVQDGK